MILNDAVEIAAPRITRDGYLVADVRAARVGIQHYTGHEVGKPELQTVAVYRPPEEVFKADSMASFAFRPVTVDHPKRPVTSTNWKDLAVGTVGGDVVRDGGFIRVPLTLMDQAAINAVQAGTRELSMGYACRLEFVDGVSPDGEPYQAIQRDLEMNHVALVDRGRAGSACRIGDDGKPQPSSPSTTGRDQEMTLQKTIIDGVSVEVSDTAAQLVQKVQTALGDATAKALATDARLTQAVADHGKAIEAKDAALTAAKVAHDEALKLKDAAITDLTAKLTAADANLDDRIVERQAVVDAAARVAGKALDGKGKTTAAVRREAIVARLGDSFAKDRSDETVKVQFDALVAALPAATTADGRSGDPIVDTMRTAPGTAGGAAHVVAHDKYVADLTSAWKGA